MKKIFFLFTIISIFACSSSNDDNDFQFQGNWIGTYTGTGDNGTFNVIISSNGTVTGTATSIQFDETYQLNGTVSNTGELFTSFGVSSAGGTFNGQLNSDNTASGTWSNNIPNPDLFGTWNGTKQ